MSHGTAKRGLQGRVDSVFSSASLLSSEVDPSMLNDPEFENDNQIAFGQGFGLIGVSQTSNRQPDRPHTNLGSIGDTRAPGNTAMTMNGIHVERPHKTRQCEACFEEFTVNAANPHQSICNACSIFLAQVDTTASTILPGSPFKIQRDGGSTEGRYHW